MSYSVQNIRNVCLLGHSGNGKTALAESMLYLTGVIDRMGRAADGNTVCDYDPEEIKRQISITTSVAPIEYKGCKINILDTPGGFDFAGETIAALRAADAAIIVCSAKDGLSVGLEKAALSISPRWTRITPTITPPSRSCVKSTATRWPLWSCRSGTRTRRSPASSTC